MRAIVCIMARACDRMYVMLSIPSNIVIGTDKLVVLSILLGTVLY